MGQYAEDILDGVKCEACGDYMEFGEPGFGRCCPGCQSFEDRQPVNDSHIPIVQKQKRRRMKKRWRNKN